MKTIVLLFAIFPLISLTALAQEEEEHHATKADAIEEFFRKGELMRKAKQYDKALLEYDYALAISDTISRVHFAKAMTYYAQKNTIKAIETLERTLELAPKNMQAYSLLIKLYGYAKNNEQLVATLKRMAEAQDEPQEKQETVLKVASYYIGKSQFETAKEYTDEALKLDKTNLEALYHHAQVCNALGDYNAAKTSMESATQTLGSDDPKVIAKFYFELGYAYHHLKDYEKKEQAFLKADVGPFKALIAKLTPEYFYNLGSSYAQIYDLSSADAMLKEALRIDPNHTATNKLLAEIAIKAEHHPQKAIDYFKKAIEGEEDSKKAVALYDTVIELLLSSEEYDEAIKIADECLSKALNARNILLMKSMALHKTNKTKEALVILEKLVLDANLTPIEIVKYNFATGVMQRADKNFDKAKVAFSKAGKGPFSTVAQHEFELMSLEQQDLTE